MSISEVVCPDWCTGEHAFVDEHNSHGFGTSDHVCIVADADYGREDSPTVLLMLGEPGRDTGISFRVLPREARALLECLRDPAMAVDIISSLETVLSEIGA